MRVQTEYVRLWPQNLDTRAASTVGIIHLRACADENARI